MLHSATFEFIIKDAKYTAIYSPAGKFWNIYGPMWGVSIPEDRLNQVVSQTRALHHIKATIKKKSGK